MSEKSKVITNPTPVEIEDLESAARFYVLDIVRKGLTIPEDGEWTGALGHYKGEKCQAILTDVYHIVRKALFPDGGPWRKS